MATKLEESTKTAKKLAIGCVVFIVAILVVSFVTRIFKKEPPPCIPYPTVASEAYGLLPKTSITTLKLKQKKNPKYKIDTVEGILPDLPSVVNVYKTKTPIQSLTAYEEAVSVAEEFDFHNKPKQVSDTVLQWSSDAKILKINKLYKKVTLTTNFKKSKSATAKHTIKPEQTPYINRAKNILERTTVYSAKEIKELDLILTYLKMNKKYEFVKAKSPSDANFVRIDFFRSFEGVTPIVPDYCTSGQKRYVEENISEYEINYNVHLSNPYEGQSYVILGGLDTIKDLYEMRVLDWEIDNKSTYYLKPVSEVWELVKGNKGKITSIYEKNGDYFNPDTSLNVETFLLNDVDLVYQTSTKYVKYIQPLYRFTAIGELRNSNDEAEIIVYYPAVINSKDFTE